MNQSNLPPGVTDQMIEDYQNNSRRGPKTKASKGERRNVKLTITIPATTNDRLIDIQGNTKMSHLINELILEALENRKEI